MCIPWDDYLKFHSSEIREMVNENWLLLNVQFHFRTFDYMIITSGADGLAAIYLIYSMRLVSSLRTIYLKRKSSTHKNNHNSNRLHLRIPIVDLMHVVCILCASTVGHSALVQLLEYSV